jgi:Xylanase inhibitor N-terminal
VTGAIMKWLERHGCRLLLAAATTTGAAIESPNGVAAAQPFLSFPLIPFAAQQRRRRLSQIAGLYHGYGTHYVDLWCGTPPQRQTVIVDTGSGATAFPCSDCTACGVPDYHMDDLYQESSSATFRALSCNECFKGSCRTSGECTVDMVYEERSSWSAYEAVDTCYIGGLHSTTNAAPVHQNVTDALNPWDAPAFSFPLKFGCQTRVTGMFEEQLADGM